MKILVACEMSGIVRESFKERGHDALSCDLMDSEINGQHYKGDVLDILYDGWDMLIAHPPCTFLCRNRAQLNKKQGITPDKSLFMEFFNSDIPKICIENPVPSKKAMLPKYDQIIQPYHYGHDYSKKTCLWLKNLPNLESTNIVELTYITTENGHKYTKGWYKTPRNSIDRSRTFQGIASAMASQWG